MARQEIDKLVWIDLETTGLSLREDVIIQVAILVTDTNLNIVDENGYSGFVKITDKEVSLMDDIVLNMHTLNGVINSCKKSDKSLEQIDIESLEYISQFVEENKAPLCGNNISFDRQFIDYHMPLLSKHLHYRNIDVSTVKQLFNMWRDDSYVKKESTHEALDDIRKSVEEMRYYMEKLFLS